MLAVAWAKIPISYSEKAIARDHRMQQQLPRRKAAKRVFDDRCVQMVKSIFEGDAMQYCDRLAPDFDLCEFEPTAVGLAARKVQIKLQDRGVANQIRLPLSGNFCRFLL